MQDAGGTADHSSTCFFPFYTSWYGFNSFFVVIQMSDSADLNLIGAVD